MLPVYEPQTSCMAKQQQSQNEKLCYQGNNLNTATLPVLCHGKIPQHFCQDHLGKGESNNCYKPLKKNIHSTNVIDTLYTTSTWTSLVNNFR